MHMSTRMSPVHDAHDAMGVTTDTTDQFKRAHVARP